MPGRSLSVGFALWCDYICVSCPSVAPWFNRYAILIVRRALVGCGVDARMSAPTCPLNLASFGEASRPFHEVLLLGDRGIYIGHQKHSRWAVYCFQGLYDPQVVGREYGGATSEND